jgi:hypothetical protein
MDPATDPRDPRYVEALKVLLDLIRKECKINAKTRLLVNYFALIFANLCSESKHVVD